MADIVDKATRSRMMSRIGSKDTKPEMIVRRMLHGMGYRYRLHAPELPGKPDIVFRRRRVAVFVHGCFWHNHQDPVCKLAKMPASQTDFWKPKFAANRDRDARNALKLEALGWTVVTVWECELVELNRVKIRLVKALGAGQP